MVGVVLTLLVGGGGVPAGQLDAVPSLQLQGPGFIDLNRTDRLGGPSKRDEPTVSEDASSRSRTWIPFAAAGGALVVTGGIFYGLAKNTEYALLSGDPAIKSREEMEASVRRGVLFERAGWAGMGLGLAAGAAGAALYFLTPAPEAKVAVLPTRGGAAFVISGGLP